VCEWGEEKSCSKTSAQQFVSLDSGTTRRGVGSWHIASYFLTRAIGIVIACCICAREEGEEDGGDVEVHFCSGEIEIEIVSLEGAEDVVVC
jgi:hypothetical protein